MVTTPHNCLADQHRRSHLQMNNFSPHSLPPYPNHRNFWRIFCFVTCSDWDWDQACFLLKHFSDENKIWNSDHVYILQCHGQSSFQTPLICSPSSTRMNQKLVYLLCKLFYCIHQNATAQCKAQIIFVHQTNPLLGHYGLESINLF